MTKIRRIELNNVQDLNSAITDLCDVMDSADFKLVATFVYQLELVLIFQK